MNEAGRGRAGAAAVVLVAGTLVAWLWPLGVGGRMPVGGDATRFSIGLMAEYDRALAARRIPLWNANWGYGFPGLAESQMGVYYPPHVVLYGLLSTEAAYTASLVLHTFWAAIGVLWASRRFGMSPAAGGMAALAWVGSGFFAIHLAHPWAITVGSWMPWAWGLSWSVASGGDRARRTDALLLAIVLALQVLPGHFQLAFITQVSVALLVLAGWSGRGWNQARRVVLVGLCGLLGMGLASAQLVPTLALARAARADRDFDYLSGFAAPPPMLVSYIAPGLFHGSPLWRPIVWDPLHASPEEHLAYVGILPLILALGAAWRQGRSDRITRALVVVALGTLLLSFGPYLPGFRLLIQCPGFSYFRAPARWGVATQLALAMLSGVGLDRIRHKTWRAPSRSLCLGAVASSLVAVVAVGLVEATRHAARAPAASGSSRALRVALGLRPWPTAPDELPRLREGLSGPPRDALVIENLLRRGDDPATARWERDRWAIYVEELSPLAVVLGLVLGIAALGHVRRGALLPALLVVTAADLVVNAHRSRLVESAPIAALESQSAVLGAMAPLPEGSRVLGGLGNLPMVAGVAPLESYRTLDRPIMGALTAMATGAGPGDAGPVADALRAVGARLVVRPGGERGDGVRSIQDDALTRWLYGQEGAERLGTRGASYSLWEPTTTPVRAWVVPESGGQDPTAHGVGDDPRRILAALAEAQPAAVFSEVPEQIEAVARIETPGLLLVTVLDDPEWQAEASHEGKPWRVLPIQTAFAGDRGAGWMGVRLAEPGNWMVRLRYRGHQAAIGRQISIGLGALLLLGYGISLFATRRQGRRDRDEGGMR